MSDLPPCTTSHRLACSRCTARTGPSRAVPSARGARTAMSRASGPDLKKYMDKALTIKMNGNRRVSGVLRGYDQFLNLVLEDATEDGSDGAKTPIGMVVLRGNGIIQLQSLERLS